jgi:hypothetical protein
MSARSRFLQVADELEQLQRSQESAQNLFGDRDQWSPHANHHHAQYVQRLPGSGARGQCGERIETSSGKIRKHKMRADGITLFGAALQA